MSWQLTAKTGPSRGESWSITTRPMTLGRSLNCDISIQDLTVSRRHCQLYVEGDHVVFRDLGSRNISMVNGAVTGECHLRLGDELSVGVSSFILTRTTTPRPTLAESMLESPPSTVSLRKALLDSPEPALSDAGHAAGSREVIHLYHLDRRLSQVSSEEAFAAVCLDEMRGRFSGSITAGVCCGGLGSAVWFPDDFEPGPEVMTQVRTAMESGRASLLRHRRRGRLFRDHQLAATAPFMVSGKCRGALAVVSTARNHPLEDADLVWLEAMARTAAPLQVWRHGGGPERVYASDVSLDDLALMQHDATALRALLEAPPEPGVHTLITGENNAATLLAAQLLHTHSPALHGAFVRIDCAAVPASELLPQLAGTGREGVSGLLHRAARGTLVLGNVEAIDASAQRELLNIVRRGRYYPEGGAGEQHFTGRLVATSRVDLAARARSGDFDRELLDLLAQRKISIEPLEQGKREPGAINGGLETAGRRRGGPVADLAPGDFGALPLRGNALEMSRSILHALRTAENEALDRAGPAPDPETRGTRDAALHALEQAEQTLIRAVLSHCNGDVGRAAEIFGLPPSALRPLVSPRDDRTPPHSPPMDDHGSRG